MVDRHSLHDKLHDVQHHIQQAIFGNEELIEQFLTGILAGGHILLEGMPGLGKTQLVRAFSSLCSLDQSRIQFTPDLMPLDITGANVLSQNSEGGGTSFEFHPGPIFTNLLLADEINRASPKTQSALLEAMQERHVTVLGTTRPLPLPFAVLATQNPVELEGTYPLPEAQLDRFLFKLTVPSPSQSVLKRIITELDNGQLPSFDPILSQEEFLLAMQEASRCELSDPVADYIARLVAATHRSEDNPAADGIAYGASPRAAIALASSTRSRAFLQGRDTVGFEDVDALAEAVLSHRLILDYASRLEGLTPAQAVQAIVESTPTLQRSAPESVMERLAGTGEEDA